MVFIENCIGNQLARKIASFSRAIKTADNFSGSDFDETQKMDFYTVERFTGNGSSRYRTNLMFWWLNMSQRRWKWATLEPTSSDFPLANRDQYRSVSVLRLFPLYFLWFPRIINFPKNSPTEPRSRANLRAMQWIGHFYRAWWHPERRKSVAIEPQSN